MELQDSKVRFLFDQLRVEIIRYLEDYIRSERGTLAELKDRFRGFLTQEERRKVRTVKKLVDALEESGIIGANNVELLKMLAEKLELPEMKHKVEEFVADCSGIFKRTCNAAGRVPGFIWQTFKGGVCTSAIHLKTLLSKRGVQMTLVSAAFLYTYGTNPEKLKDLLPFVSFGAEVISILRGSVVFVLKVSSISSLKRLWQSYKDGSLKEKLKKSFNEVKELKEVSQGEEIDVEVTIDEEEYREVLFDLILFVVKGNSTKNTKRQRRHSICCERDVPEKRNKLMDVTQIQIRVGSPITELEKSIDSIKRLKKRLAKGLSRVAEFEEERLSEIGRQLSEMEIFLAAAGFSEIRLKQAEKTRINENVGRKIPLMKGESSTESGWQFMESLSKLEKVTEKVLGRIHEYQGCQLTVQEYQPSTNEYASILVSGLSNKFSGEALQMYFENTRSGGGDVTNVEMKGDKAVVTFVSQDSAKRVLARKHEYQGYELNVEEYKPSTDDVYQDERLQCTSILVSGLSTKFTNEALQMYFENTRSGGDEVTDVQMKGDKAVVTFTSPEAAQRVLARTHEYQGCQLTVEEYQPSTDVHQDEPECAAILVRGLSNKFTDEALQMYFENTRSGGGDVTNVKMRGDKAVVTFASPDVAKRVVARTHRYQGCQLTVQEYKPSTDESASVLVTGLSNKFTDEALQMYFENTRSGGGDVTNVEVKGDKAVVTFASSDVAKRVLARTHEYQGCQLSVQEYKPSTDEVHQDEPELPLVSGIPSKSTNCGMSYSSFGNSFWSGGDTDEVTSPPVGIVAEQVSEDVTMVLKKEISKDPKAFYVTGIREISKEKFITYMEWISKEKVESVVYGSNLNAIVTFENPPDFRESHRRCSTRTVDGIHLQIEQVNICNCIEVTGLAPETSKDTVFFYFDNPLNGGGKVENVKMDPDNTRALVFFQDPSVLNSVTKQEHKTIGAKLKIVPYYHLLGEISASPTREKKEKIVKVHQQTRSLIEEFFRQQFEQLLQEHRVKYTWQQGSGEIVLGCADPKMDKTTWENVSEAVVDYINQIVTRTITVSEEVWNGMLEEAKEMCASFREDVAMTFKEKERAFILTGQKTDVFELQEQLNDLKSKIEKQLQFDKNKISENVSVAKALIELLKSSGFFEDLQARCKGLEVKLLKNEGKISFRGPQDVVREGINETVLHTLPKVKEREMELPKSVVGVVCSDTGKLFMELQFKQANINAVVSSDAYSEMQLIVTAMSQIELKKAVQLIKDLTSEQSIPLDDHQKQLIQSEKWKKLKHSIQQSMLLQVTEEPSASTLWVAGIKEEVDKAKEKVERLFEDNLVLDRMVETDIGRVKYIFRYEIDAIQNIESTLRRFSVKITKSCDGDSDVNGILVSGTTEGVEQAVSQVKKLINDIKDKKVDLETQGIKNHFKDKTGAILLSGVENKHSCIIELCTQKHDTKPSLDESKSQPKKICTYVTPKGKKISLYKGDLTEHKVDVMVNAANESLNHSGGLAKSIVVKGGQEIQDECDDYVMLNGNLLDGEVFVSKPGELPCKCLVHAVGPRWGSTQDKGKKARLGQTVYNSLEKAKKFTSIAIPAISAGIFGCPADVCAKTLIDSVFEYSMENSDSKLTEFHFVDLNDSVITAFHNEMTTRFGKESSFIDEVMPKARAKSTKGTATSNVGDDPNSLTTAKGMEVKIDVNDIAKAKTSVIVNTVASDLDLSKNPCAKALSNAAGPGLQQECKTKGSLSAGQMLVTDGYNLGCKNVFHVVVAEWQNGKGETIMRSLIQSCLKEADKRGLSSIAFPAIGTGNLGFPRAVVARAFFEEADNFKGKNPQSLLTKVHIVLFHKDQPTVQVFQQEVKNRKTKRKKKGKHRIYKGGFSSSPSIGSVRLDIISGDITKETTDAIVIPATPDLKVAHAGKLGIAVNEVGGPGIQQECNQKGPQNGGSVVCTSPGSLLAGKIFHLVFGSSYPLSRLTEIMEKCLKNADAMGIKSIAVPAIGTGMGGMSPKNAAKALLSAVGKFSQGNPHSVNHIRIVVFEKHMITDFHNAIQDLSESKTGRIASLWQGFKSGFKGFLGFEEVTKAYAMSHNSTTSITENAADEKMWLQVFAASYQNLKEAEASIKEFMQENSGVIEIVEEAIGNLSPSEIDRIQQYERQPNIQKIQIDKMISRIIIRGGSEDINNVRIAIYDILNRKAEEKHNRRYAELLAENVQWHYMDGGTWESYDDEANAQIEQAYKDKERTVMVQWVEDDDDDPSNCQIDFIAMTETDLTTGETTQVERRSKATGIQLPVHWDSQPTDSNGKELDVHLVPLDQNTKEYIDVKKAIEKTSAINIVKIERVQNPSRYRAYVVKKHEMDNKNGSNEKKLFHGTAAGTCQKINHKGFNRSYCGKNATAFGQGVYFARDASYSMNIKYSPPDSAGNRYMYLASVLVGEYTKGTPEMIEPPPKDPNIPTITYDSVVNNINDPAIYVVFHDDLKYSSYLITFK